MVLGIIGSALALTVPVTVTYKEEVGFGESAMASSTISATVGLSNPQTNTSFVVSQDELTVSKREASGSGEVSFHGATTGSIRTWEVYYLTSSGAMLGMPEVVDILFDANGNGAVAARVGASRLSQLSVQQKNNGTYKLSVNVQDAGIDAAYIGIVELTNDGTGNDLYTNPDMEIMDAGIFASFQGLGLQSIVLLDTFKLQLSGSPIVSGLSVASNGSIENNTDLQWNVSYYDGGNKTTCNTKDPASCKDPSFVPVGYYSYLSEIKPVKKNQTVQKVSLKENDLTYDVWDASATLSVGGDIGAMEMAALLRTGFGGSAEVISLNPSGRGIEAKTTPTPANDDDDDDYTPIVDIFIDTDCEDCGDYDFTTPNPSNPWTYFADDLISIEVFDSNHGLVATHTCTLAPTARTLAGTASKATLVGECSSGEDTTVRRLEAKIGPLGGSSWSVDMSGEAFAMERAGGVVCSKGGSCETTPDITVIGGHIELVVNGISFLSLPIAVTSTEYDMPFSFPSDIDGTSAELLVQLSDPAHDLVWEVANGIAYGYQGRTLLYTVDVDSVDVSTTGMYDLKSQSDPFLMADGDMLELGQAWSRVVRGN